MNSLLAAGFRPGLVLALAFLASAASPLGAAETSAPPAALLGDSNTVTRAEPPVRRDDLDALRREIELAASRNAQTITTSLGLIETVLARSQQRESDAARSAQQMTLIVSAAFALLGFSGLLCAAWLLARTLRRFSDLAVTGAGRGPALWPGSAPAALEHGGPAPPAPAPSAEQASAQFQGALEQLQKRIVELEHALQPTPSDTGKVSSPAAPPLPAPPPAVENPVPNIRQLPAGAGPAAASKPAEAPTSSSRVGLLLGKGQALLNLDNAHQALGCFEQAIAIEPNNPEIWIRRGLALEKMEQWEPALDSYTRALSIDDNLTVAWLYKGGVCNRLQRHREALDSYEKALHAERHSRAS